MPKHIKYGDEARKEIFSGMQMVADAVKVTMGPKGRNVILERSYGGPIVTNDGVTVAKEIELEDKSENIGASISGLVSILSLLGRGFIRRLRSS